MQVKRDMVTKMEGIIRVNLRFHNEDLCKLPAGLMTELAQIQANNEAAFVILRT